MFRVITMFTRLYPFNRNIHDLHNIIHHDLSVLLLTQGSIFDVATNQLSVSSRRLFVESILVLFHIFSAFKNSYENRYIIRWFFLLMAYYVLILCVLYFDEHLTVWLSMFEIDLLVINILFGIFTFG